MENIFRCGAVLPFFQGFRLHLREQPTRSSDRTPAKTRSGDRISPLHHVESTVSTTFTSRHPLGVFRSCSDFTPRYFNAPPTAKEYLHHT